MRKIHSAVVLASAAAIGFTFPAHVMAMTYTLEPLDYDHAGVIQNITQEQLGGTLCPCTKIPYPATSWSNGTGVTNLANAINSGAIHAGDTVMGFSNGSVVIAAYLNSHTPPPGIRFLLMGTDTSPYGYLTATGWSWLWGGFPAKAPAGDSVIVLMNEYDGWGNYPTNTFATGYKQAVTNAEDGKNTEHNYINATILNNPNNVTWTVNGVTYEMIPSATTPLAGANRSVIAAAYGTAGSQIQNAMQEADAKASTAATLAEQVPGSFPPQTPEPVLGGGIDYPTGTAATTASATVVNGVSLPAFKPGPPAAAGSHPPKATSSLSTTSSTNTLTAATTSTDPTSSPNTLTATSVTATSTGTTVQGRINATTVSTPAPAAPTATAPSVDSTPVGTATQSVTAGSVSDPKPSLSQISQNPTGSQPGGHPATGQTTAGSNATGARSAQPAASHGTG